MDQVATGQDSDALRHLVEHSATVGTLDERYHAHLTSALELESLTVGDVVTPNDHLAVVGPAADADEIQTAGRTSGHLRLLVRDDASGAPVRGVVHVRDSLTASPGTTAADLMRPVLSVESAQPVYETLTAMREQRAHLALVTDGGRAVGLITINDVLQRLLATTA